jgi:predicted hydrocarbon binding protein
MAQAASSLACSAERFAGGRVKGSMLRAHVDWVRDHRSREETIEFFESIPGPIRQQLGTILPTTWHPFETLIAVDRIILERFGDGHLKLAEELGCYSARLTLSSVYRSFRRDDVHDFFVHSALLHQQYQDFGTAAYYRLDSTAGRMAHRDYTSYSPLYCASAVGFYREAVRLHGGTHIEVVESECQCDGEENCTFELSWH